MKTRNKDVCATCPRAQWHFGEVKCTLVVLKTWRKTSDWSWNVALISDKGYKIPDNCEMMFEQTVLGIDNENDPQNM